MKFFITKHCLMRYGQRVNGNVPVKDVKMVLNDLYKAKDVTTKIYDEAPRFILFLYEKYKTASQKILQLEDKLFICTKRAGTKELYDVLTMYKDKGKLDQFKNSVMKREDIYIKIKLLKSDLKK